MGKFIFIIYFVYLILFLIMYAVRIKGLSPSFASNFKRI